MAYDENLVERISVALGDRTDVSEQKMFGGLTFMLRGNMCCGVEYALSLPAKQGRRLRRDFRVAEPVAGGPAVA